MRIISILSLCLSFLTEPLWAQLNIENIHDNLFADQLLNSPSVPGELLFGQLNLQQNQNFLPNLCSPDLKFSNKKKKELKLILMTELRPMDQMRFKDESISFFNPDFFMSGGLIAQAYDLPSISNLSVPQFQGLAQQIGNDFKFAVDNDVRKGAIQAAANLILADLASRYDPNRSNDYQQEKENMTWILDRINSLNPTHDEFLLFIAQMSESLYKNYNNPRNFTTGADAENRYLSRMAYGLMNGKPNDGGVCDDIAAIGCDLYKQKYPDKDCLTASYSGVESYHVVMMVGDGSQNYTIINGSTVSKLEGQNYLTVDPNVQGGREAGTFIRLQQVIEGKLKDVYLVKNEYGEWIDRLTEKGQPGQSIVSALDPALARQFGQKIEIESNARKKTTVGSGQGKLTDGSNVYAVYARFDRGDDVSSKGLSATASYQDFSDRFDTSLFRVHLQAHISPGKIFYQDERLKINGGVFARGNLTMGYTMGSATQGANGDAGFLTGARAKMDYTSTDKKTSSQFQLQQSFALGSKNYGGMHSFNNFKDAGRALSNVHFYHQSLEANLDVKRKIKSQSSLVLNSQYRGTNVGNLWTLQGGISVEAPEGVEIIVMAGYTGTEKGFKTQGNFLSPASTRGVQGSVGIQNKKGLNVRGQVQFDPKTQKSFEVGVQATVPIQQKKTRRPK